MNDIDLLMSKLPKEMTDKDIDEIVLAYRRHRANLEAGIKPKRERAEPLSSASILHRILKVAGTEPKPKAIVKRRI